MIINEKDRHITVPTKDYLRCLIRDCMLSKPGADYNQLKKYDAMVQEQRDSQLYLKRLPNDINIEHWIEDVQKLVVFFGEATLNQKVSEQVDNNLYMYG
jgi:hypothetical protein